MLALIKKLDSNQYLYTSKFFSDETGSKNETENGIV